MAIHNNENITKDREIKLSGIPQPSSKSQKYLYAKYMAYTVITADFILYNLYFLHLVWTLSTA